MSGVFVKLDENGNGWLSLWDPNKPVSLSFQMGGDNGTLFTVHPDGRIERGPAFTTEDEASLHFWDHLQAMGLKLAKDKH